MNTKDSKPIILVSYIISIIIVELFINLGVLSCFRSTINTCQINDYLRGFLFSAFIALFLWYFVYIFLNWIYKLGIQDERKRTKKILTETTLIHDDSKKILKEWIDSESIDSMWWSDDLKQEMMLLSLDDSPKSDKENGNKE